MFNFKTCLSLGHWKEFWNHEVHFANCYIVLFLSPCNMRKRWRIYLLPSRWHRARHPRRHCNCPCRRVWSDTAPPSDQRRCRGLFIPGTLTWTVAAFFVVYFSNLCGHRLRTNCPRNDHFIGKLANFIYWFWGHNRKSVHSTILSVPIIPFIFMAYRECGDVEAPVSSVVFGDLFRQ